MNRGITILLILLFCFVSTITTSANAQEWKFGVMSDTQWPTSPDHKNPSGTAINIANHLNREFLRHGVKFVVQVGDLTDAGSTDLTEMDARATFAQALYNAGIGFYPLRGNHETSAAAGQEFAKIFPQTQDGRNNRTPSWAWITYPTAIPPYPVAPAPVPDDFTVGLGFNSPTSIDPNYLGLTYSFDYANARFILLDTFTVQNISCNLLETQQPWITDRLHNRPGNTHAFVFSHKGLITENHTDIAFTGPGKCNGSSSNSNPSVKIPQQNDFMGSLYQNKVHIFMGGHDHMHNRAIVTSPDGTSRVQNIIAASNSYKFYIPRDESSNASPITTNDYVWNVLVPAGDKVNGKPIGKSRELPIAQELGTVGYYIFTVNGPRVTVDFYSSPNCADTTCNSQDQTNDLIPYTFTKRETFGYSLNGQEFLVPQGASYDIVEDAFGSTTAKILAGSNGSKKLDFNSRQLTKAVDTGWSTVADRSIASDVLTLWGMTDNLGSCNAPCQPAANVQDDALYRITSPVVTDQTDVFVLSMTYDVTRAPGNEKSKGQGSFRLVSKDASGNWVKAVGKNIGNSKSKKVVGPYRPGYGLGTYGVDPATATAWAVINYNGDFAVAHDMGN